MNKVREQTFGPVVGRNRHGYTVRERGSLTPSAKRFSVFEPSGKLVGYAPRLCEAWGVAGVNYQSRG